MSSRIQMAIIICNGALMGLEMSRGIQGKNVMLMIELVSKYLTIKRPTKRISQHAGEQCEHDKIDMVALIHAFRLYTPVWGNANVCFCASAF